MKLPGAILLFAMLHCIVGCSGPAFWNKTPAKIDAISWNPVPEDHVRWLERRSPNYDRAVQILSAQPVAELSPEQVREFWTDAEMSAYFRSNPPASQPADGTHAFLVRGITYDPALRCRVWSSGADGPIWTHFQSWTEEGPITAAFVRTQGSPVIVFLDSRPSLVYATAEVKGDDVFKGTTSHP